jgi:hypothetical protein
VEKYGTAGQAAGDNKYGACVLHNEYKEQEYRHIFGICNYYCFSTTTTRENISILRYAYFVCLDSISSYRFVEM